MNEMRYVGQLVAKRVTNFFGEFKCANVTGGIANALSRGGDVL